MNVHSNTSRGFCFSGRSFLPGLWLLASVFFSLPVHGEALDHSGAAKAGSLWQTEQPGFRPDLTYPILYTMSLQGVSIGFLSALDKSETGFTGPSARNFERAFKKGPSPDDNEWYWNYVSHPFGGSESYLRARAQGCSPLGAFLFSGVASTVWEFGIEGWFERPSSQDLIVTPLAGSLIGEARFRAKRALLEADTPSTRVLAVVIDPLQSLAEVIGHTFGQDWREPGFRKDPVKLSRVGPVFTTGLASASGRPALTFNCRITF